MALFRHHQAESASSKAGGKDAGETTRLRGIVASSEPGAAGPGKVRVTVTVRLKSGEDARFTEELANLYQPEPGSPDAQRLVALREAQQVAHPARIPKIQLPLSAGGWVPVRSDPSSRKNKFVIDVQAMQRKALDDFIERETTPREPKPVPAHVEGPPWVVPTACPLCGAPIDQAVASKEADPKCEFCREPIPVKPLGAT